MGECALATSGFGLSNREEFRMKRLALGPLVYEYSRHVEPRLKIEPGETIAVETEDAFSGQIRTDADRRDKTKMPFSNPQTGPIWVSGAEPGDALAVTIKSITPTSGQCVTRTGDPFQLAQWLGVDCPHGTHVCPIREGQIHWSDTLVIPYAPMLGCIGTAPNWGVPSTAPAGPHGGNMDIIEVCPGNTIYLPVYVTGGYLYLGDAHAAMGHGELSANGLEMPAESVLTIKLLKNKNLAGPRIESPTEIMTVESASPMERSSAQAFARLILWMEAYYGWNRWRAYDLLTHVARLSIGYYAIGTIAAKVEKRYLAQPS
jgi:amidase